MTDNFRAHLRLTALLVDGDNISPSRADEILARLSGTGPPEVRRVYGNIVQTKGWASRPGFRTIHSGEGKNATDLLISIEAMDLLHQGRLGCLVLVSSDGDFTHLAHRLREEGIEVVGMGEEKTPGAMRAACSRFVLLPPAVAPAAVEAVPPKPKAAPSATGPGLLAQPAAPQASTVAPAKAKTVAKVAKATAAVANNTAAPSKAQPAASVKDRGTPPEAPPNQPAGPRASAQRIAAVTALGRALLLECPDPRGMALIKLGPRLHQGLRITLKELGASSWHGWFAAQPQIFTCEPKGADCHVRLAKG